MSRAREETAEAARGAASLSNERRQRWTLDRPTVLACALGAASVAGFAPLYLYPGVGNTDTSLFSRWPEGVQGRTPNIHSRFVEQIADGTELRFVSDGRGDLGTSGGR